MKFDVDLFRFCEIATILKYIKMSRYLAIYDAFLKGDAERERRHRRDEVGEIIKIKKIKKSTKKKNTSACVDDVWCAAHERISSAAADREAIGPK